MYQQMIKIAALFLLLFLCGFHKQKDRIKDNAVEMISISITDGRMIATPNDVECNEFEQAFSGLLDTISIKNEVEFKRILMAIKNSIPFPEANNINTRGKMVIRYESGRKDVLCFEQTNTFFKLNGVSMRSPAGALQLLIENAEKK